MTENRIPTEQELDGLLKRQPQFDLDAVKRRTLSRVGGERPGRNRMPLRGLLIAAVVCALSVSAMAAADYATNGQITMALGLQKEQAEPAPEPASEAEMAAEEPPVRQPAAPDPAEPEPAEPPELDGQIAAALQISRAYAQTLRPAVQAVEQTAENQDIRMTVLQTLGDASCLYVKLRFDFPEGLPAREELEFQRISLSVPELDGCSLMKTILERSDRSITYLLTLDHFGLSGDLNGKTAVVTFENYGTPHRYTEDEVVYLRGEAGKPYTTIIYPDRTLCWDASESDVAALPAEAEPAIVYPDGFTVSRRVDGSKVVTYDGAHGDIMREAYLAPDFESLAPGTWEQAWTLSYQDLSVRWAGEAALFDAGLTITGLRISPLSWEAELTASGWVEDVMGDCVPRCWTAQLRHQDGSLTELWMEPHSGEYADVEGAASVTTAITVGQAFDQPIDLSDVTAVRIDGKEFPLN